MLESLKTLISGLKNWVTSQKSDWNQNDSTATNYIKNRPFYTGVKKVKEPLTIKWDGNTEGLISVQDMFFKVSDIVLTDEQIKTSVLGITADGTEDCVSIEDLWEDLVADGSVTEDYVIFPEALAAVIRKDNLTVQNINFPEKGIYFIKYNANVNVYVSSLTVKELLVENTIEIIHKIDEKYLPELENNSISYIESQNLTDEQMQIARENIGAGTSDFSGSYNDLSDKPSISTDVVQYNVTQSLTDTQKEKARDNIGAIGLKEGTDGLDYVRIPKIYSNNLNIIDELKVSSKNQAPFHVNITNEIVSLIGETSSVLYDQIDCKVNHKYIQENPILSFKGIKNDSDGSIEAPIQFSGISGIILNSSTEGSTKQFRITVDDTGALKTENVEIFF